MKILLEPTRSFEVFKGAQFRLFKGHTDSGIEIQMLGMFRISDPNDRAKFVKQLVDDTLNHDTLVTPMLDVGHLVT